MEGKLWEGYRTCIIVKRAGKGVEAWRRGKCPVDTLLLFKLAIRLSNGCVTINLYSLAGKGFSLSVSNIKYVDATTHLFTASYSFDTSRRHASLAPNIVRRQMALFFLLLYIIAPIACNTSVTFKHFCLITLNTIAIIYM